MEGICTNKQLYNVRTCERYQQYRVVLIVTFQYSMDGCRAEPSGAWTSKRSTKTDKQKLRHSHSALPLLYAVKTTENDCPEAWTNRILVLNIVHEPPGDDNFSPPLQRTPFVLQWQGIKENFRKSRKRLFPPPKVFFHVKIYASLTEQARPWKKITW